MIPKNPEKSSPARTCIEDAARRIRGFVHPTPVLRCSTLDALSGCSLFFKCENFQRAGAFKIRGAANAALSLSREEVLNGLATHSSGNHAQALALVAKQIGVPAYVVMPSNASSVKKEAVIGYGAKIISCEPTLQSREATLAAVLEDTGAAFIHPYNDARVICGQGTCAYELLDQEPSIETVVAPVGGGGLLGGTALAAYYAQTNTTVIGAEPEGADDAMRSVLAGHIIPSEYPDTIADGLLTSLGDKTFPLIKKHVDRILTVSDEEIIRAMQLIWERMKILVEASGAVPLAAVLKYKREVSGKKIGIILSGGNVDLKNLPW